VLERFGVDPARPSVVFVGRITRQKGVPAPAARGRAFAPGRAARAVRRRARHARDRRRGRRRLVAASAGHVRDGVIWIDEMLPKPT
jgi:starch synthase